LKKIRIISLGEIVSPNLLSGLTKLTETIAKKSGIAIVQIASQMHTCVQDNFNLIEAFKTEKLSEPEFNKLFIDALKNETGVRLSVDELDSAWDSMNPQFFEFKHTLEQIIACNREKNPEIVLISDTNPKDIRHLIRELQANNIPFGTDAYGHLNEISGMTIHTTYTRQLTKADLLKDVIIQLRRSEAHGNSFFNEHKEERPSSDIKYIYGVNHVEFSCLKEDFDNTTAAVQKAAGRYLVETILWNKELIPLRDLLKDRHPLQGLVCTSTL